MTSYIIKRSVHGLISIAIVIGIVMLLIYGLMDRNLVFAKDSTYTHIGNNKKVTYRYSRWEEYGYLKYVNYSDYLQSLADSGEIDEETRSAAVNLGRTVDKDSDLVAQYVEEFTTYYENQGYTVERLDAVTAGKKIADGGQPTLFAYKDVPLFTRLGKYFKNLISIDNIHKAAEVEGERGYTWTWYDPAYGGEKFSPALMGNGTKHKYLLYFDNQFPFIHQNLITIQLGVSYSVNKGVDVADSMSKTQGKMVYSTVTYPTGLTEESADNLHTATYLANSQDSGLVVTERYTDDYTNVDTYKKEKSKLGFSFVNGIIATFFAYLLAVPISVLMARKKDKLADQIGTAYIVIVIAVPSLAYIFFVKAVGGAAGLPTTFNLEHAKTLMYVLPIISLTLPSIGGLMRWLRRFLIDQMNMDYVKFARSEGLTEGEIFNKHILKNASIPLIQGIPGSILFAMVGAFITERVYTVPGAGGLLIEAIQKYDNSVIVGVTLFYAVLSVVSAILGDVLMAVVDPRISFATKDR